MSFLQDYFSARNVRNVLLPYTILICILWNSSLVYFVPKFLFRTIYSAGLKSHQVITMANGNQLNLYSRPGQICTVLQCWSVLYYTIQQHTFCVLHCPALYCTDVMYFTVLYCTDVLYCTVLYCSVLYCTVLYCTVLYCTVLYTKYIPFYLNYTFLR